MRRLFFWTPPALPVSEQNCPGSSEEGKNLIFRDQISWELVPSERSAQELFVQGRDKGQHENGSLQGGKTAKGTKESSP